MSSEESTKTSLAAQCDSEPIIKFCPCKRDRTKDKLYLVPRGGEMSNQQFEALSRLLADVPRPKRPDLRLFEIARIKKGIVFVKVNIATGQYTICFQGPADSEGQPE